MVQDHEVRSHGSEEQYSCVKCTLSHHLQVQSIRTSRSTHTNLSALEPMAAASLATDRGAGNPTYDKTLLQKHTMRTALYAYMGSVGSADVLVVLC